VLFVDGADGKGLGMMVVMWSNASESYWQSLRVAEAARGRGVAAILFRAAAKLAVERQGEHSISRWGVVSNNSALSLSLSLSLSLYLSLFSSLFSLSLLARSRRGRLARKPAPRSLLVPPAIMTKWSQRLGLHGPQLFRRHSAPAAPDAPSLPPGYVFRAATAADIPLLWPRLASFPVATSEFGSQNFVASGWATFDEEALTAGVAGQLSRGIPMPQPRLLLDARGELVAFASIAHLRFGERCACLLAASRDHRRRDYRAHHPPPASHHPPAPAGSGGCLAASGGAATLVAVPRCPCGDFDAAGAPLLSVLLCAARVCSLSDAPLRRRHARGPRAPSTYAPCTGARAWLPHVRRVRAHAAVDTRDLRGLTRLRACDGN
jgi:hypothetical protein